MSSEFSMTAPCLVSEEVRKPECAVKSYSGSDKKSKADNEISGLCLRPSVKAIEESFQHDKPLKDLVWWKYSVALTCSR